MANLHSLARPYASAAFQVAHEANAIDTWSSFLKAANLVAKDDSVIRLLHKPGCADQCLKLFTDVLSTILQPTQRNFLQLLAQNQRLGLLPAVASLFEDYKRALNKISRVRVVTAVPIDEAYQEKLSSALTKRMQFQVIINPEVDPSIIGGAIIHIGDRVIDGSVRGKLNRLMKQLTG